MEPDVPALDPVTDPRIAEALAVLADEYEALNARGRESLLLRFWAAHPDLRESARSTGSSPGSADGWWRGGVTPRPMDEPAGWAESP